MYCVVCGAETTKRCSACHHTPYCGAEHQKLNWPFHEKECKLIPTLANGGLKRTLQDTRTIVTDPSIERLDSKKTTTGREHLRVACPTYLDEESVEMMKEEFSSVPEDDMQRFLADSKITESSKRLVFTANSLSQACKAFMGPEDVERILAKIYDKNDESVSTKDRQRLAIIYETLVQTHKALFDLCHVCHPVSATEIGDYTIASASIGERFAKFYDRLCPVLYKFSKGEEIDEITAEKLQLVMGSLTDAIDALKTKCATWGQGMRSGDPEGMYGVFLRCVKIINIRNMLAIGTLFLIIPWHSIVNSKLTEGFVTYLQTRGYSVPAEYFDLVGGDTLGIASGMNHVMAGFARNGTWSPLVAVGLASDSASYGHTLAQYGINGLFSLSVAASRISATLYQLVNLSVGTLCSSVLEMVGVPSIVASVASSVMSFVIVSFVIYKLPHIYKWLRGTANKKNNKLELNETAKKFYGLLNNTVDQLQTKSFRI